MSQRLADGFGSLGELEDYHYSFVQDGKVTLVGRKYVAQPTHNWGHRVAFAGTYVLTFDKAAGNWERHDFPELVSEENVEEVLFVREGTLYLLTFTNFGETAFQKLFKWEFNFFVEVPLTAPAAKSTDENERSQVLVASGVTSKGETLLLTNDEGLLTVFSLTIDGNSATIERNASISNEENPLRGQPVIGEVFEDKLFISVGVHGCGFRWERSNFFEFDVESKAVKNVTAEGDYDVHPKFGFNGPNASVVNPETKSWIVAAGFVQKGMCDSEFSGAVWALKDAFGDSPKWVELPETVEQGEHVFDGLTLYTVTRESISEILFQDV